MKHSEPEAEVAKLEEQNLEIPEICQELKEIRTMVHAKDVETQKFGTQLQNIKGCHERLRVHRDDLARNLRRTSMIRRSHRRHDQDLKSLMTLRSIGH